MIKFLMCIFLCDESAYELNDADDDDDGEHGDVDDVILAVIVSPGDGIIAETAGADPAGHCRKQGRRGYRPVSENTMQLRRQ